MEERFTVANAQERLAEADRQLKAGVKPETVALHFGYKNKESMMAGIYQYRKSTPGAKSGVSDSDDKPEAADFLKESLGKKSVSPFLQGMHRIGEASKALNETLFTPQQQEASSFLGYDAQPMMVPVKAAQPVSALKITALKGMYAHYSLAGADIDVRINFDHGSRAEFIALAKEIMEAVNLLLPEVGNVTDQV